jgi:hypothetical protein
MTPRLQMSLEAQAVKEGLLQRADYAMGEIYPVPSMYGRKDFDARILPYLSIFPDVTLSRGDFLLGSLRSTGLSVELIEPRFVRWPNFQGTIDAAHFKELVILSNRDALTICKAQKSEIISITSDMVNSGISSAAEKSLQRQSFMPVVTFLSKFYLGDVAATPFQGLGYEEQIAINSASH